jgi:transcription initiation factor TFIID subunit 3
MSTDQLYTSLLRPPVLHILRAAGFHAARPAALDTMVDIASRYLILLASRTAAHAYTNHNEAAPTILDVEMALQDVGALTPQLSMMEEQVRGREDTQGMDNFLKWMTGPHHREIRRIAGLVGTEAEVLDGEAEVDREDFLAGEPPDI